MGSPSTTCRRSRPITAPFCMKEQKTLGEGDFSKIPNGAPGIETRMSLVYDGGVRRAHLAQPLRRAHVDVAREDLRPVPRKGTIAPGSDADIVIFDPQRTIRALCTTLHMKVDYNPYEDARSLARPTRSFPVGVIVDAGMFTGGTGAGAFLKRRAMTGDEIIALTKKHHLRMGGAGRRRPDSRGARQGVYSGRRRASASSTSTVS